MNKLILILLAGLPALAPGSGASVEIGTNSIPLRVLTETPRSFDTNRVAREFSLYCASSSRIEDFFTADPSVPGSSSQMDPNEPEGGPPETAAENIRYHATPDERIEMGPEAANWILGILDQADIHTNAQTLATVLLDGLMSGSITNDMDWCRESFVVNGAILTNSVRDAEIRSGIAAWWTKHRYYPPSLFGWRLGRLVEGGVPMSAIRVRYELPPYDGSDIRSELLVFLDGRWRIALSE